MDIPFRYKINTSSFRYYWSEGVGKELLLKLGYVPEIESAKALIPELYKCDKMADEVVTQLYLNEGFSRSNDSLLDYFEGIKHPQKYQNIWDSFFNSFELLPNWVNKDLLKKGSELSRRAGLSALIVLRDYCLMGGYESAAINKPLIYTGALKKGAVKRLTDTVNFWVHLTKKNALEWNQEGLKQLFQTRFIHAYSRVNILLNTDWDDKKWGLPINNWDMLATNLGFSIVFVTGLRKIGIIPSDEEVAGIIHFWKYIGYLLGIPLHLLPDNEHQAIESLYYWTMTQREGDSDSQSLARALMEEPIQARYPTHQMMRMMMKEVHLYYNRYLLGNYSCDLLGLPNTNVGRFGIINIWKTRQNEKRIIDQASRQQAIREGERDQEHVRHIYQRFNK